MKRKFEIPRKIITGTGAHKDVYGLSELSGIESTLLVHDKMHVEPQVTDNIRNQLVAAGIGFCEMEVERDFISSQDVDAGVKLVLDSEARAVIAVGGRRAIQLGKLIGLVAANGVSLREISRTTAERKPSLPVIAIAMTTSSGSAISRCACYLDETGKRKCCVTDSSLIPAVAVLDPGLSNWQSPEELARDGVVSLAYAVEAVAARTATPVTDACAAAAISSICKWLPVAFAHGYDLEARQRLMFGQQLVAMAISNSSPSALCKLAGHVELHTHIALGNAMAALLPPVLEFYEEAIAQRTEVIRLALAENVAAASGQSEDQKASGLMRAFLQRLDLPLRLSFLGLEESSIPAVTGALDCGAFVSYTPLLADQKMLTELLGKAL